MIVENYIEEVTLRNLATGEELFLSERGKEYVLDGRPDWDYATATVNFVGYVNQIGGEKTNTKINTRPMNIVAWAVADGNENMKKCKEFLNRFVNPFQDIRLFYREYYIDFTPSSSVKYAKNYQENNEVLCKFEIAGTCGVPLFAYKEKEVVSLPLSLPIKVFPLQIPETTGAPLGLAGDGAERVVNNKGSVDTWYTMYIEPGESPIENPKISITYKGLTNQPDSYIELKETIAIGETLIIDSTYGKESIMIKENDGSIRDVFTKMTRESTLFLLGQGENVIKINDKSGTLENLGFRIEFSPLFMEVQ